MGASIKNKYILKNYTRVKRWGTPQNFCLALIDEREKQLFIKKLSKWPNKNKEKHPGYHYFTTVYQNS